MKESLTESDFLLVSELIAQRFSQRVNSVKERQVRKFNRLLLTNNRSLRTLPDGATDTLLKPVVNLSDRVLTANEQKLLNKGLNFNISPGSLKPIDVIPVIEEALSSLPVNEANSARLQSSRILNNQKPQTSNLTAEERVALNLSVLTAI